jgi:hypothetical protein
MHENSRQEKIQKNIRLHGNLAPRRRIAAAAAGSELPLSRY